MAHCSIRPSGLERVKDELWSVDFVSKEVARQSYEALCQIRETDTEWVLTHGDYGAHNVLVTDTGLASVIDWEFGEWNHPLNDVTNVHFWTHLHFPDSARERCQWFLEGFGVQYHLDAELLRAFCIYRIWYILLCVRSLPDKIKVEWIRRLMTEQSRKLLA